jgi:GTPase
LFDKVGIFVRAGNGGNGAISFRKEKFVPFGGPDGGDGGKGGDVIIRAEESVDNLYRYRGQRRYRAEDGGAGMGRKKHGKNGSDLVLAVPAGTVVWNRNAIGDDAVLADLAQPGQEVIVAKGGRGGWGNTRYATSTNQAPQIAQSGAAGEEASLYLEMKLIADAGLVGLPNAGKSTLLAAASAARPKIAGYPFTTIEPALGTVAAGKRTFVLAEIPGLVTDAHLGRGLGHDFLRHVARTRALIHLVDGSAAAPAEDMMQVNRELALFDSALAQKPQLVALNKVDLPEVQERKAALEEDFRKAGINAFFISAESGEGVPELMAAAAALITEIARETGAKEAPEKVFRPRPVSADGGVRKEGRVYLVTAPDLARLRSKDGGVSGELRRQLMSYLAKKGITAKLEKAGIRPGDRVRVGELEWEW